MQTFKQQLEKIIQEGFVAARFDACYGTVTLSNRPDLCDYQCTGALKAAKIYGQSPMVIAEAVTSCIQKMNSPLIQTVQAIMPGFINLTLTPIALANHLNAMAKEGKFGYEGIKETRKVLVDYGGANVAKALHVGHLRSAVIGESLKRLYAYSGHNVIGDIHLGDWGLQMGLVIEMLKKHSPDLCYFDMNKKTDFPVEPPFDIKGLSELYTEANKLSKEDENFRTAAQVATVALQSGREGYRALRQHMMTVSKADLKKNYHALNVEFDLWLGESDSQAVIPDVADQLYTCGILEQSQGAGVVFVNEPEDTKPMPPCMLINSKGGYLYAMTDLATIAQRMANEKYDEILYVVDKRQTLHFEQIFRTARKAGFVSAQTELNYVGFGTMNGMDGKPFKTRDGGVMALEDLIELLRSTVSQKMSESDLAYSAEELDDISIKVGLAAMKFADLSNQTERDYVFDLNQFVSFDGKTGPYIQYAGVRMASILEKAGYSASSTGILEAATETEGLIHRQLSLFSDIVYAATVERAPHKLCEYVFELSKLFNRFYHETRILSETDVNKKQSWLATLDLMKRVLFECLELLGIHSLVRM